jgi:hypothetical protein
MWTVKRGDKPMWEPRYTLAERMVARGELDRERRAGLEGIRGASNLP